MSEPKLSIYEKVKPFLGRNFNKWVINHFVRRDKIKTKNGKWAYYTIVNATCECGISKEVNFDNIKSGLSKNCGCVKREKIISRSTKHGFATRKNWTKEHKIWCGMISRCSPNHPDAEYYFNAGVRVCERWLDFTNFIQDMGFCPDGKNSIDRYPNKRGDYCPGNCRWADKYEQSRNRINNINIMINGVLMTVREAEQAKGVPRGRIASRLKRGYSEHDAINLPCHQRIKK